MIDCFGAATVVGLATLEAQIRSPIRRGGWLGLLLSGAAALLGAVLGGPLGAAVGALLGLLSMIGLVMVLAWIIETRAAARATALWSMRNNQGWAVARTHLTSDGDWLLSSVAAIPSGWGLRSWRLTSPKWRSGARSQPLRDRNRPDFASTRPRIALRSQVGSIAIRGRSRSTDRADTRSDSLGL